MFEIAVPQDQDLGKHANLIRINLNVVRPDDKAPAEKDIILKPISQQPGLFETVPHTLQHVWASLGFGPEATSFPGSGNDGVAVPLKNSLSQWRSERTTNKTSISPHDGEAEGSEQTQTARSAILASLPGTDWFAPKGPGPLPETKSVTPVLLPVGFAPCRPNSTLRVYPQNGLQGFVVALKDVIDLAYLDWSNRQYIENPGAFYRQHFKTLGSLCYRNDGWWAGPLVDFTKKIVDTLLFPQIDIKDENVAPEVKAIASKMREQDGDFKYFKFSVQKILLEDISIFGTAKSLLLTQLQFKPDAPSATPATTMVAGARFTRQINMGEEKQFSETVNLTLKNLTLSNSSMYTRYDNKIGFLEVLDDSLYGNYFDIPNGAEPSHFMIDSYEEKVDPQTESDNSKSITLPWPQNPVVGPYNDTERESSRVHLASREFLVPPINIPMKGVCCDDEKTLFDQLKSSGSETLKWSLEKLKMGEMGDGSIKLKILASHFNPLALAPSIEHGLQYKLFKVVGNEEGSHKLVDSFANDSFFVKLSASSYVPSSDNILATNEIAPGGDSEMPTMEQILKVLATESRGSLNASNAIRKALNLNPEPKGKQSFNLWPKLNELIDKLDIAAPDLDFSLIHLGKKNQLVMKFGKDLSSRKLKAAVLFGHVEEHVQEGRTPKVGYLLLGFETSVWTPLKLEFSHGRNIPWDQWYGVDEDIFQGNSVQFPKEFWQHAQQDAAPSRHFLKGRQATNEAQNWAPRTSSVVVLDRGWRHLKKPRDLIERLLFSSDVSVGENFEYFTQASKAKIFQQELSVQVFHEQFMADPLSPGAIPFSRFPTSQNILIPAKPKLEPKEQLWFEGQYNHFSVDFHWFAPNGTKLLSIDRVFVIVQ